MSDYEHSVCLLFYSSGDKKMAPHGENQPETPNLTLWVKGELFTFGTVSGTPHPRLGFSNIRKMVAYCKNKGKRLLY